MNEIAQPAGAMANPASREPGLQESSPPRNKHGSRRRTTTLDKTRHADAAGMLWHGCNTPQPSGRAARRRSAAAPSETTRTPTQTTEQPEDDYDSEATSETNEMALAILEEADCKSGTVSCGAVSFSPATQVQCKPEDSDCSSMASDWSFDYGPTQTEQPEDDYDSEATGETNEMALAILEEADCKSGTASCGAVSFSSRASKQRYAIPGLSYTYRLRKQPEEKPRRRPGRGS